MFHGYRLLQIAVLDEDTISIVGGSVAGSADHRPASNRCKGDFARATGIGSDPFNMLQRALVQTQPHSATMGECHDS
jgi:hypothetical protein